MVISLCKWVFAGLFFFIHAGDRDLPSLKHPFYVSVTEINHNARDQTIEVSCKIFTDDLEKILGKISNAAVDLSDQKNKTENDKLIAAYIPRHLQLRIDDKIVTLQFIGSEKESEATWSYFQANNIPSVKKIDINNDLLYELYDSQVNIIHIVVNEKRESTKLSKPDVHAVFLF